MSTKRHDTSKSSEEELVSLGEAAVADIVTSIRPLLVDQARRSEINSLEKQIRVLGKIGSLKGADAILETLGASARWLQDIEMTHALGPMGPGQNVRALANPNQRGFSITLLREDFEAATSLRESCRIALLRLSPSALPLISEHMQRIKSRPDDYFKSYELRALRRMRNRLWFRKCFGI